MGILTSQKPTIYRNLYENPVFGHDLRSMTTKITSLMSIIPLILGVKNLMMPIKMCMSCTYFLNQQQNIRFRPFFSEIQGELKFKHSFALHNVIYSVIVIKNMFLHY